MVNLGNVMKRWSNDRFPSTPVASAGAWTTLGGVADGILRSQAQKSIALTLARAGDPTRLIEAARRASDVASRVMALAAAAEDVMRSANELQRQGGSIFLAPESGLL